MRAGQDNNIEHCLYFISSAVKKFLTGPCFGLTFLWVISIILLAFLKVMQLYGGIAMKLRIFLIFTIFTPVLLLSSCIVTSHDYNVELSCEKFDENSHNISKFEIEVGDKIRVRLCSNPTTGFEWDYETTIENVLKEEDHDFEEPKGGVPGAAGIEVWAFEAVKRGQLKCEWNTASRGKVA